MAMKKYNDKILWKMAVRSLQHDKSRTRTILLAIILSVFLVFTILTVGSTYWKMEKLQTIRQHGAKFDAVLMGGVTQKQREICKKDAGIATIGFQAYSGYSDATEKDDTLHSGLIWCDKIFWEQQMAPAREWVKGSYPQKENELMVTPKALEDCGMGDLTVGDSFELTYGDKKGLHTKTFTISGIWDGYGDRQVFFVSKKFFENSGYTMDKTRSGSMYLDFRQSYLSDEEQQKFFNRLELGEQQYLQFNQEMSNSIEIMIGAAGLIIGICLSAYLFIYNILSLSLSSNIRYYGLLETIGMTGSQIRKCLKRQMVLLAAAGIAIGMILGVIVSFRLVPFIVTALGIHQDDVHVVFHLALFLLAAGIACATIFIGNRHAMKTAGSVSPVEALSYRGISGKQRSHKTRKGHVLWRMAAEQLRKDTKKSITVVLSLAASFSIFVCLITLIQSHGARTVYTNYMNQDLIIQNDTLLKEKESDWEQIMDEDFLDSIREIPGVENAVSLSTANIIVPWDGDLTKTWMTKFYEKWMENPFGEEEQKEYQQHPEHFPSVLYGISHKEFDYLNKTLEEKISWKDFKNGKVCLLYNGGMTLEKKDFVGKTVAYSEDREEKSMEKMKIGGLIQEEYYASGRGEGLVLLTSQKHMEKVLNSFLFRIGVSYQEPYDQETEEKILRQMEETPGYQDFSYESKIEDMEEAKRAQGNMMGVGIGLTIILAWIGIMNYINTVSGNISSRQTDLAVLEGIGMTRRQIKGMLIREGLLYSLGSWGITATIGMGAAYLIYQKMNSNQIPFEIPWPWILGMAGTILIMCVLVPLFFYHMIGKRKSLIDRIREIQ